MNNNSSVSIKLPIRPLDHTHAIRSRYTDWWTLPLTWGQSISLKHEDNKIRTTIHATTRRRCFFVGFAYADLPFTKRFDVVFPKGRPQDGVRCVCRIIAATQDFGKPFPEIPHGWKTICLIQFTGGMPRLVRQLPVVDSWYQNKEWVCICDEATWDHLKKAA